MLDLIVTLPARKVNVDRVSDLMGWVRYHAYLDHVAGG
jgi:hypothetical protein